MNVVKLPGIRSFFAVKEGAVQVMAGSVCHLVPAGYPGRYEGRGLVTVPGGYPLFCADKQCYLGLS